VVGGSRSHADKDSPAASAVCCACACSSAGKDTANFRVVISREHQPSRGTEDLRPASTKRDDQLSIAT